MKIWVHKPNKIFLVKTDFKQIGYLGESKGATQCMLHCCRSLCAKSFLLLRG